jgi:hypothetical protein
MLVVGIGYAWFWDQSFKNDIIHKGLMITGKYDVDPVQAEYLANFYSRKHFERPKFGFFSALKDKLCGWTCCDDHDEHLCPEDQEGGSQKLAAGKIDDELLDHAFDGILERQLDMKYVLQLIQDIELIKRVVFQERH